MAQPIRNRRTSSDLTDADVDAAIDRLAVRDESLSSEARHVYSTLTWGEGPALINQSRVQHWLWYQLATKYITDEAGYMARLAGAAAILFDELGLHGYAAVCRSPTTAGVHAAFDRSSSEGMKAMRKAMDASGIEPPSLDDFGWGQTMGMEEASARTVVEDALEQAISAGELVVGGRGWRGRQREIAARALDADHPEQPGQSWRTAILTERIGDWIHAASRHSAALGQLRAGIANRLLHPVAVPLDVVERFEPVTWLLDVFGDEQPLTQAGYLNRPFVLLVNADRPWDDPFGSHRPPHTESDEVYLSRLRELLQALGALRKRGRKLQRTKRGAAMASDPAAAWSVFVDSYGAHPWDRFVTETAGLLLLDHGEAMETADIVATIAGMATDSGWRASGRGDAEEASDASVQAVTWSFRDVEVLFELLGLLNHHGDWRDRRCELTAAGEATMLAMLRATSAGPRDRP